MLCCASSECKNYIKTSVFIPLPPNDKHFFLWVSVRLCEILYSRNGESNVCYSIHVQNAEVNQSSFLHPLSPFAFIILDGLNVGVIVYSKQSTCSSVQFQNEGVQHCLHSFKPLRGKLCNSQVPVSFIFSSFDFSTSVMNEVNLLWSLSVINILREAVWARFYCIFKICPWLASFLIGLGMGYTFWRDRLW